MTGTRSAAPTRHGPRRADAGIAGVMSAAVALGVGELVAGVAAGWVSPVEAVATEVIDRAPLPLERFAIETFGNDDKLVLVVGVVATSLLLGAGLGLVARRRPALAAAGFAGFALVGMLAGSLVPSLAAGVAGIVALLGLGSRTTPRAPRPLGATSAAGHDRRRFLSIGAAAGAAAALAAVGGRSLRSRFSAADSRAAVQLPRAARPLPAVPAAVAVDVAGVAPFVTPNADFYRVDTALIVPQVRSEDWTLDVTGLVDRPLRLRFDELLRRVLVEADITMTCVSNPVGGDLVGHARWLGVPVRELLEEAGARRERADQLVGRSTDGYTCGFPLDHAYDTDALVAVGMNGEPLPLAHGFPARLVTPGLYGYVGSSKWLTELEVTTFDAFDQYWVRRGYADRAPVKTMSRIDAPRSGQRVRAGRVPVAGVAWAQTRGIEAVEVQVDDGPFAPAELAEAWGDDAWRQWRFDWDATPGRHNLTVRAVDGTGATQTERRRDVVPDGASGWMSLVVLVDP